MSYRNDKFKIGDKVIWSDNNITKYPPSFRDNNNNNNGPFEITYIEDVYQREDELNAVGHTQFVKIDNILTKLSGSWFKKLKTNK